MATKIKNLPRQVKGDTISIYTTVRNRDEIEDITGSTSSLVIEDVDGNSLATATGSFVTDGTDGDLQFHIAKDATNSANLEETYYYYAKITLASGREYTLIKGELEFTDAASHTD